MLVNRFSSKSWMASCYLAALSLYVLCIRCLAFILAVKCVLIPHCGMKVVDFFGGLFRGLFRCLSRKTAKKTHPPQKKHRENQTRKSTTNLREGVSSTNPCNPVFLRVQGIHRQGKRYTMLSVMLTPENALCLASLQFLGRCRRKAHKPRNFSATPQQNEICVKISVFHTIYGVKFW